MKIYIYNNGKYFITNVNHAPMSPIVEKVGDESDFDDLYNAVDLLNKVLEMGLNPLEPICVISYPDWNGGRYNEWSYRSDVENINGEVELNNFEYLEWEGTLERFLIDNPEFTDHYDSCWQIGQELHDESQTARNWINESWQRNCEASFRIAVDHIQKLTDSWNTLAPFTALGWVRNACPLQEYIKATDREKEEHPFESSLSYWVRQYGIIDLPWLEDVFAEYVLGYAQGDKHHALYNSTEALAWAKAVQEKK